MSDEKKKNIDKPLILKQNPGAKNKGSLPLPYNAGRDTYDIYSNPKNPFSKRMLAKQPSSGDITPEKVQSLFHYMPELEKYELILPTEYSPYNKRRIANPGGKAPSKPEFAKVEEMRESHQKLQPMIETFFDSILYRLEENPYSLPLIINELVPLFKEIELTIRIYDAFRQFYNWDQFIKSLEKISQEAHLESFELFCSALFGFYSQLHSA